MRSLPAPTGLAAAAITTSSAFISWNPSADAHHYVLEQKSQGSGFVPIQSVQDTSFVNTGLAPGRTYLYRVRAVSPSEAVSSPPGNADLATTLFFSSLTAGETLVAASHFDELLTAVNAVRGANGAGPLSWASLLPFGVPAPAPGVSILGQHIVSLRSAMNDARTALGLAALTYTDPVLTNVPIRVLHHTEIRGGVE